MVYMGFVAQAVGGLLVSHLVNKLGSSEQKLPKIAARDILPTTQAQAPNAPVIGNQTKTKGRNDLIVPTSRMGQGTGVNI